MLWKNVHVNYGSMKGLFLGSVRVGTVSYNSMRPKGQTGCEYVGSIALPAKDSSRYYGPTEQAVKQEIERRVVQWLVDANLQPKDLK